MKEKNMVWRKISLAVALAWLAVAGPTAGVVHDAKAYSVSFPGPGVSRVLAAVVDVSFVDNKAAENNATTNTFATVNFGTASAGRYIYITPGARAAGVITFSSITIGGVSASVICDGTPTCANVNGDGGGNTTRQAIWAAAVPSGTSGTVVITCSSACARVGFGAWAVTGLSTVVATKAATTTTSGATMSTNVNANGAIICGSFNGTNGNTYIWGGTGIAERFDASFGGTSSYSGADGEYGSSQTILVTATSTNTTIASACASIDP